MHIVKNQKIADMVKGHKAGYGMDQPFYNDPDIYERDVERVFLRSWLYAGHDSEIPEPGDYLLLNFANESVIVVRDADGAINALLNVCRHRGSRVCLEQYGHAGRLSCQYHGWTYALDGTLIGAAHMGSDFDKSALGLKHIHVEVFYGMIFVNFAREPAPFSSVRDDLDDCLRPYALDQAKVAHRERYSFTANWKLAVENYSECYHCAPAHPEYSRGHALALVPEKYAAEKAEVMARAESCGLGTKMIEKMYTLNEEFGNDRAYTRYPLVRGFVTGSKDGKPLAPLLGSIRDYDGGTTDFQVGPVMFALAYCDHVVLYRFLPLSADSSECDISWLVRGDAVEGRDYDRDALIWLWDVTTKADKRIVEHNQEGVNSRYYEPGPYSRFEVMTNNIISWYLRTVA